jgi:hypothetical protein
VQHACFAICPEPDHCMAEASYLFWVSRFFLFEKHEFERYLKI